MAEAVRAEEGLPREPLSIAAGLSSLPGSLFCMQGCCAHEKKSRVEKSGGCSDPIFSSRVTAAPAVPLSGQRQRHAGGGAPPADGRRESEYPRKVAARSRDGRDLGLPASAADVCALAAGEKGYTRAYLWISNTL